MQLHVVMQFFCDAFFSHSMSVEGHAIDIDEDTDEQNKDNDGEEQIHLLVMIAHEERIETPMQVFDALLLHIHFISLHEHQRCFFGCNERRL